MLAPSKNKCRIKTQRQVSVLRWEDVELGSEIKSYLDYLSLSSTKDRMHKMTRVSKPKKFAVISSTDLTLPGATSTEDQVLELDCAALVARIRDGSLRAEQVCEKLLQQHERYRSLNAITWIDESLVIASARNIDKARDKGVRLPMLAGLPILVKDNIDTVGVPTSAGTSSLKQHFPVENSPVVKCLLRQGVIVFGKANMHELGIGVTSTNPTFGFVRNPYNPDLIAGGSSGGSAAAIAARIVPAALGTDTGGSIRIPAAFCGIVGFRPSIFPRPLYSQEGVVPLSLDLDTIGPMGRSTADVALLHATIVGSRPIRPRTLKTVRIGIPKLSHWGDLDPEIERVTQLALDRLHDQGTVFIEIDLREIRATAVQAFSAISSEFVVQLQKFLHEHVPSVSLGALTEQIASRDVRAAVERVTSTGPNPSLLTARSGDRDRIRAAYREVFKKYRIDAITFPTTVLTPPPVRTAGDDANDLIKFNGRSITKHTTIVRNAESAVIFGAPALSIPAGLTGRGLPVALEFDGLPGKDRALLALGLAVEAAIGRLPAPSPRVVSMA